MPLQTPPVRYDLIKLQGGLDQVTPTLSLPPGVARRATNFECSITGGYTRIAGYERCDGRPNPSDATYSILVCALTGTVAVGDTITGNTSAATGKVIALDGSNVVITRETGSFIPTEVVKVGGTPVGTLTSLQGQDPDGQQDAEYRALAANDYRADIQAVPGSGSVLGVAYYEGDVYAWRNNTGGTAAVMYKSTTSGWSAVNLGYQVRFGTGTVAIAEGNTVTGATSGATGVVSRVVLQSGSWSGGDAAGRLILSSMTGIFAVGENLQVGGVTHALATGTGSAITLAPNGRVETVIANFGGGAANKRLYGCDGANRAFEWDGSVYVPLNTGMATDTPTHIAFHKQHLFLSFDYSLQFSALGDPYNWTPLLGAGELAMNDTITNLVVLPGDQSTGALGVYTRSDTSILYGTDSSTFKLTSYNTGTGAIAYSAQNMDQTYVLDDRGVTTLGATLNYGNFAPAALTMNIRPFIQAHRNLVTASCVNREKGQYRLFFSDGRALYITVLNKKLLGAMPMQYAHVMSCACEGETPDGAATSFAGSTNGFVYRLDAGTSFDGEVIPANLNLVYNSIGSPRVLKRYRKAMVEMTGDSYAEIAFGYDLGYRSINLTQASDETYSKDLRSSYWDEFTWDNFVFDGADISPSEIEITGTAENMAIRIASVSAILQPFTVNNVIVHYTPRRGIR